MKLPHIAVRERRGLRAVPWRYLSADFAADRCAIVATMRDRVAAGCST